MDYLTECNRNWPAWFAEIEHFLFCRLDSWDAIEHVGSTSIVGRPAKPIIDIDLVVKDGSIEGVCAALERAGYLHQGNLGVVGREAFKPVSRETLQLPPHHLYACEEPSPELRNHISFRNYLRVHPSDAERLAELKRNLAFKQKVSREEYIARKSPLVLEITERALEWDNLGKD